MQWHDFLLIVLVGFLAQMIDGALGMAYGVSSTTFLTTVVGIPAKIASASVHTAEVFTTFVSGVSHWKMKNVDLKIFKKLVIPGVIGGAIGAYVLVIAPPKIMSVIVSIYLLVMGIVVLVRGILKVTKSALTGNGIIPVGFLGGYFDAIGGGGWGPIVTSTMIASGHPPRYTIGSVNTAEFFVTLVQVSIFTFLIGVGDYWQYIVGLAIGGVIAAPFAAFICKKTNPKKLMVVVGILIILLNIRSLILLLN
jgi:Predicted permeases